MFAIVEIAGLQYKVEKDQWLYVNRLNGAVDSEVRFDKVLLSSNNGISVGAPAVEGITVTAKILEHVQADKVIVFKKKRRKGYAKKNGHRQQMTSILITDITGFEDGRKKTPRTPRKEVSNNEAVDYSVDNELNALLKKHGYSATKENRETFLRISAGNNMLSVTDAAALLEANKAEFKELKK